MIIFDIETGPIPDAELLAMLPEFEPPEHPGEFDPAMVKTGNLKDSVKIAAKIEEARAAHTGSVASHAIDVEIARESHFTNFKRQAALSPLTGRVLAIGVGLQHFGAEVLDGEGDEWNLLRQFWAMYCDSEPRWAGWNIYNFDLPFLIRRSWKFGVPIPSDVRDRHDRYWGPRWVDLQARFAAGTRGPGTWVKLDAAAKFFGVGQKTGNGADFAALWESDRVRAVAYVENDIRLTAAVALRILGSEGIEDATNPVASPEMVDEVIADDL